MDVRRGKPLDIRRVQSLDVHRKEPLDVRPEHPLNDTSKVSVSPSVRTRNLPACDGAGGDQELRSI